MKRAIYAGSFDPITKGHFDIVDQALKVFDEITIAVGVNAGKSPTFTVSTRIALIEQSLLARGWHKRVNVISFSDALVNLVEREKADAVIRGFRQISDFNDEFTQHGINTLLSRKPWVYFICKQDYLHVSSSSVRQMASFGLTSHLNHFVDAHVEQALMQQYAHPTRISSRGH